MKIVVYSKPNCMPCDLTKQWLDNKNVPYEAIDITKDDKARNEVIEHGFMGVPVVTVGGWDNAFADYNENKLEELL